MRVGDISKRSIQGNRKGKCKGPEAGVCVTCLRNRKAAIMA